jgi:transposase
LPITGFRFTASTPPEWSSSDDGCAAQKPARFFRAQEPSLVGMESCATAHHRARELIALGHEVKLLSLSRSDRLLGNRRNAKIDHLVEGRLRLFFMFHNQARIAEPDASGVDEARRKFGVSRRKLA